MLPNYELGGEYEIHSSRPDGHCFYRSISLLLFGTEEKHKIVRWLQNKYFDFNEGTFGPLNNISYQDPKTRPGTWEEYIAMQYKNADDNIFVEKVYWGSEFEAVGIEEMFQCTIIIMFDSDGSDPIYFKNMSVRRPWCITSFER